MPPPPPHALSILALVPVSVPVSVSISYLVPVLVSAAVPIFPVPGVWFYLRYDVLAQASGLAIEAPGCLQASPLSAEMMLRAE